MGNSSRAQAAQRAAEMRAEEARKERQRKQMIAAAVAVVVVILAVVLGTVIANRPKPAPAATGAQAALAKLVALPAATLDQAAAPDPNKVPQKVADGTPLTKDGKPRILYVGAEFCPFCAMERWVLVGALSRFGTFEGLTATTSSSDDVYPDTPTFSFHGGSYTSDYLVFDAVETADRENKPLESLNAEDQALFAKGSPKGSIPWISFGGTHAQDGAAADPGVFEGKSYDEIIAGILDPNSAIGKGVDPAINVATAQICEMTKGQPANVCMSQGVVSASVLLKR